MKKKILIIKMGYSETLDKMLSLTTSLGDVLRTTYIINYFKDCDVDWLVDGRALPLLEHNRYIRRIFTYNPSVGDELRKYRYDLVINLEKIPEACQLTDSLNAEKRIGFSFSKKNVSAKNCLDHLMGDKKLIEICRKLKIKKLNQFCFQEIVSSAIGEKWNKQKYILGYKPKSKIKYDIGFNWTTSNKWENKAWPEPHWHQLEALVNDRFSVSWQKGLSDIFGYIEWINSCRLLVTADSLGLHICLALGKPVIALFGPTSHKEIYFYSCGTYLLPEVSRRCVPCLRPKCNKKKLCMEFIYPKTVKAAIDNEFRKYYPARKL